MSSTRRQRTLWSEKNARRDEAAVIAIGLACVLVMAVLLILAARL